MGLFNREKIQKVSNSLAEAPKRVNTRVDSMYARIRRLESRIGQLEIESSTLRRDVNRVVRKQYREEAAPPPPIKIPDLTPVANLDLLYGNERRKNGND